MSFSSGMIDRFDPSQAIDQLRIVPMDVLDQLGLGVRRAGDEHRPCVGDGGGDLMEKVLIFGDMPATQRVCLVMDMVGRIVGAENQPIDLRRIEMEDSRLMMIDPDNGMIMARHGRLLDDAA
jgi:hypothetical protein